ncbi:MAG: exo-alpha-sialidase, partial [Verrucomicrobia bacterium]|nr:exo-alpha-sialidase [Verrucomicrobiota bacterium]
MMKYIGCLISLSLLFSAASPAIMAQALEGREGSFSLPLGLHKAMLLKPG